MFCRNCGKEISEGSSFCRNCGNPIAGSGAGGVMQTSRTGLGKNKKLLAAVIGGAVLLTVILAVVIVVVTSGSKSGHDSKTGKKKGTSLSDIEGTWETCMTYAASVTEALIAHSTPYEIMIGKHSVTLLATGGKEVDSCALSDEDYYVDDDGIGAYHFTAQWYTSMVSPAGYRQFRLRIYYAPDDKVTLKGEEISGVLHLEVYSEEEYITHVIGFSALELDEPYTAPAGYYPLTDYVLKKE